MSDPEVEPIREWSPHCIRLLILSVVLFSPNRGAIDGQRRCWPLTCQLLMIFLHSKSWCHFYVSRSDQSRTKPHPTQVSLLYETNYLVKKYTNKTFLDVNIFLMSTEEWRINSFSILCNFNVNKENIFNLYSTSSDVGFSLDNVKKS